MAYKKQFDRTLVCAICLWAAFGVQAKVYEWVDSQGGHHYSDRPHGDSRILPVEPGASYYLVEKVYDGDTVLLNNGQKVRLLGINTPEVAGRAKEAEEGGEEAKAWLTRRLAHKKVRLERDVEKKDKYGRTLAYLFTEDKRHINLELVERGLAFVNIYPPNLKYVDTLLAAQRRAQRAALGIWRNPVYAPVGFASLNKDNYKGWKRIIGRIVAIKKTAKYSYLQFSDHVAVRVENKALDRFPLLSDYVGKTVEARGWVMKRKDRFVVPVRHVGDLIMSTDTKKGG